VVAVRLGDDDVAAGDPIGEPLELRDVVEGRVANGLVHGQIVERHLGLGLHGRISSRETPHPGRVGEPYPAADPGSRAADGRP
jgi:hypothetical protein